MSGMRKWMVRSPTAMVGAAGSLASLAGLAPVYDRGSCDQKYGAANVAGSETFKINTPTESGKVDFGADPHWFGSPQGTAVVCWLKSGAAGVVGRVFADSPNSTEVRAELQYFDKGVAGTTPGSTPATWFFTGSGGQSRLVVSSSGAGNFDEVRIRLFAVGGLRTTKSLTRARGR